MMNTQTAMRLNEALNSKDTRTITPDEEYRWSCLDTMADAFGEVERRNARLEYIFAHPTRSKERIDGMRGEPYGVDFYEDPITGKPAPSLWGAALVETEDVPLNILYFVGDMSYRAGPVVLLDIEDWV